ncbi:MAG: hypothetical protein ABIT71_14015 [Vicinamibacteraceae bacterium]
MLQRALAGVIVARLVLAPWATAGDAVPTPIRTTAERETARLARTSARGAMPAGLKWTGTGLLIGSGLPVFIVHFGDCIPDDFSCRDQRHAAYAVAGVMAGTGALLLIIANAKRSPALPTVALNNGRLVVQQRITF